jgi:hypothetical protein
MSDAPRPPPTRTLLTDIAAALALLAPSDVERPGKIRVGIRAGDGAYILLDMLRPPQRVLSFGVGRNVSFDLDMAARGHEVFLYDHTVPGPPVRHDRFHFRRIGIGGVAEPDRPLLPLADHVAAIDGAGDDMILKMDVEGAEWPALIAAPSALLARFEQIVLEIHGLAFLDRRPWRERITTGLARLRQTHTLFHVHANNHAPPVVVAGLPVSNLLELSWVRSDRVRALPSRTLYPTALDEPNLRHAADTPLWFHPFLPTALPAEELRAQMDAALVRLDAQHMAARRFNAQRAARLAQAAEAGKTAPPAQKEDTP